MLTSPICPDRFCSSCPSDPPLPRRRLAQFATLAWPPHDKNGGCMTGFSMGKWDVESLHLRFLIFFGQRLWFAVFWMGKYEVWFQSNAYFPHFSPGWSQQKCWATNGSSPQPIISLLLTCLADHHWRGPSAACRRSRSPGRPPGRGLHWSRCHCPSCSGSKLAPASRRNPTSENWTAKDLFLNW